MKKKNIIKFISLLMLITVLISIFSLSVFATDSASGEEDEELSFNFWQGMALILTGILSPIRVLVWAPIELIKQFGLWVVEVWPSIVNFFAGI